MADATADPSPAEETELVRDALLHLHDAASLQIHPLAQVIPVQPTGGTALRARLLLQALLDAINALQPAPGTSTQARSWRCYRILELRYVEGLSANDVASRLALSRAQYQRDHAQALEAVTSLLKDRWGVGQLRPRSEAGPESRESLAMSEAAELAGQSSLDRVSLVSTLTGLLALIQAVADRDEVVLSLRAPDSLPTIDGDRVALRHAFLALITTALAFARGGRLELEVGRVGQAIEVVIDASPAESSMAPEAPYSPCKREATAPDSFELQLARQLIGSQRGNLEVGWSGEGRQWSARVVLPISRRPTVLVVDNHADFIGLVTRYLAEHDWRVVGAQDAGQAEALAVELQPSVILLDVLMPGRDGWDLLLALRNRPETRLAPVIVTSVIHEPAVAQSLGVVEYLTKPISQAALLRALTPYR